MGYVYKIVNKNNGKIYFGITKHNDVNIRFRQHCVRALKEYEKFKIHQAIKKYGVDVFICLPICKSNNWNKLCTIEIFLIKKYQTTDDKYGYNMTKGGDGIIGLKRIKNPQARLRMIEYNKTHINPMKSQEIIKKYFTGQNHPYFKNESCRIASFNNLKNSALKSRVKVNQIDVITGEIVREFDSIQDAAKFVGLSNSTTIGDCINNRQKTSKGFIWKKAN